MNDPLYDAIKEAMNDVSIVYGIAGAQSQAIQELIKARKAKTTWFSHEMALRYSVDDFLDGHAAGWRK